MLKRYFSLFFLFIFLANGLGFGLFTFFQIRIHRQSDFRKHEKEQIVELQISLDEINSPTSTFYWLEENEFSFHDNRYDVITSKEENGILKLKCYQDGKEESLYKKLKEHSSSNENNLPAKNKNTLTKKGIDYDHAYYSFSCFPFGHSNELASMPALFPAALFISVASPPPRFV